MATASIFVDTMIYLHCMQFDQIDFRSVLGVEQVTLLIPRITFKELEKHKASHSSGRTRERARQALALLEKHIESGVPVREGVSIVFISHMPRIDMEQHGLNPAWNDDVLIASVLEHKATNPGADVRLVTHDTGARLTCKQLGVTTLQLPENYRLPEELDDSEREAQRLQREVQKLKSALPKLVIGFGDDVETVGRFVLGAPQTPNEAAISAMVSELRVEFPERLPSEVSQSESELDTRLSRMFRSSFTAGIPAQEFSRYETERQDFFLKYEKYLRAVIGSQNRTKRTLRFTVAIRNDGSAPADDVDVKLHFPDGFSLCTEEALPKPPKEPRRPTAPRTQGEMMISRFEIPVLRMPELGLPNTNFVSSFKVRKTNSYDVSDHFDRIKHGQTEELPELFLTFDSYEAAKSFHCDYFIHVGNLPETVTGKLHFVIEKGEVSSAMPNE